MSERHGTASARSREFRQRPLHERPRERLMFVGPSALTDDEIVALVLGSGAALPLARRLLDLTGGPTGLRRAGVRELCDLPGLGPARACQIKAGLELGRRALLPEPLAGLQVRRAADVAELLRVELSQGEQEAVHVFGLDARHRIRCRHVAAVGQIDRVQVSLADIFRPLVREGMATALVAHNHPSGSPRPSPQDRRLTVRMAQVGHMLGISLLDHIIVARGGYFSFSDAGVLASVQMLPPAIAPDDDTDDEADDGPARPEASARPAPTGPTAAAGRRTRSPVRSRRTAFVYGQPKRGEPPDESPDEPPDEPLDESIDALDTLDAPDLVDDEGEEGDALDGEAYGSYPDP
ncbi:MAG: DNA repair protein RadC [Polyangia bacterium]